MATYGFGIKEPVILTMHNEGNCNDKIGSILKKKIFNNM